MLEYLRLVEERIVSYAPAPRGDPAAASELAALTDVMRLRNVELELARRARSARAEQPPPRGATAAADASVRVRTLEIEVQDEAKPDSAPPQGGAPSE